MRKPWVGQAQQQAAGRSDQQPGRKELHYYERYAGSRLVVVLALRQMMLPPYTCFEEFSHGHQHSSCSKVFPVLHALK